MIFVFVFVAVVVVVIDNVTAPLIVRAIRNAYKNDVNFVINSYDALYFVSDTAGNLISFSDGALSNIAVTPDQDDNKSEVQVKRNLCIIDGLQHL